MKHQISLLFLLVAFAVPTFAQNARTTEKQQAVKELVTLIGADSKADDMMNALLTQFDDLETQTVKVVLDEHRDLSPADRKAIEELILSEKENSSKRFEEKLISKMNFNELMSDITYTIYDKHYTLEEIRDLITFYKTPTGQKSIKLMTPIMTDTMQLVSERMLTKIPVVIKEIEAESRIEIEQKNHARKSKSKSKATE